MDNWQEAWHIRTTNFPMEIGMVRPRQTLPISLTGTHCALGCAHCAGHYLRGMVDVQHADAAGMTSCLISGGCDEQGRVPVTAHLEQVAALRAGRVLNWHVGFVDEHDIHTIAPFVDMVSFDFVGDDVTIQEVYGFAHTVDDYARAYALLRQYFRVIPHLTLGLRGGCFSGEYAALDRLRSLGLDALAVLVFMPTAGTRYAGCPEPPLDEINQFLLHARCALPDTPIYLGCMRPGGRYRRELDSCAVRAGVNKIVNPTPPAVRLAEELGLTLRWETECCVIEQP